MRKVTASLAGAVALTVAAGLGAAPAQAQDTLRVKLLATAVLPDGKIKKVDVLGPLPADTQTEANNNVVPTVAIEYFFVPNISLETICCVTQHDVDITAGALTGKEAVSNARVVPATFTLKYHLNPEGIDPYVGAGPTYFIWINDAPGADTIPLPVTSQHLSNEFGFALQAGVDVPVSDSAFVSLDAKKYWVDTTATWYNASTTVIQTKHKLDPWVLSAGVGFRF